MKDKIKIFTKNLPKITAEDIMSRKIITVSSKTPFNELIETLVEHKIGGVPVVNEDKELIGIVSKSDIVTHTLEKELKKVLKKVVDVVFETKEDKAGIKKLPKRLSRSVGNIMTHNVITASPDTQISDIADLMLKNKIHRIIITENKKVVGIVTALDILELFPESQK